MDQIYEQLPSVFNAATHYVEGNMSREMARVAFTIRMIYTPTQAYIKCPRCCRVTI
jgi:hypothetical protein